MSIGSPFMPQGNQVGFAAATVAPTPVQLLNNTISMSTGIRALVVNWGPVPVVFISGQTAAAVSAACSAAQSASPVGTGVVAITIPSGRDRVITVSPGCFISGITAVSVCSVTAVIGEGDN